MEKNPIDRRQFLKTTAGLTVLGSVALDYKRKADQDINASSLPRWRGFNLLEKFILSESNDPFKESDFEMIAELGLDFVRLPMSYLCWSDSKDWKKLDEKTLKEIDQAVELGKQYGVHTNISFHRAPGYSVHRGVREPFNLWMDEEAQQVFDCSRQKGLVYMSGSSGHSVRRLMMLYWPGCGN